MIASAIQYIVLETHPQEALLLLLVGPLHALLMAGKHIRLALVFRLELASTWSKTRAA